MSDGVPSDRKTARLPEAVAERAISPVIGERVHNYEIVSKIGEGGMGAVYLASHQFFERKAALKVLHPHLSGDETSVRRFMNEARAVNSIRHPNIIEVVDTGFLPSGAPYLLTEYLEGESLGTRLRRLGRLPFDTALQIAGQTASALAAAHDQGILHRDLKPENLFLVPRTGYTDFVKVLDFGIAKLRTEPADAQLHTEPGTWVGTPRYMSPEQCRGGSWPVDQRTDIYSLGVMLYEMLCGVPPFESQSVGELIAGHLTREPEPLRTHVSDVPPYVEAAVLRALAKQPSERFADMRELRAALGSPAIPRVPPLSSQMPAGERPAAFDAWLGHKRGAPAVPGRRARWVGLAALLAIAVAVGVAAWQRQGRLGPAFSRLGPGPGATPAGGASAADSPARAQPAPTPQPAAPAADPVAAPTPAGLAARTAPGDVRRPADRRSARKLVARKGAPAGRRKVSAAPNPTPAAAPQAAPPKKFVPRMW